MEKRNKFILGAAVVVIFLVGAMFFGGSELFQGRMKLQGKNLSIPLGVSDETLHSPINLSVEKADNGKLTLKWDQPESGIRIDRYYVTAEKGSGGFFTNESKSTATSLVINYIPGEVTTYYVKAKYANGESSENSESVIFDATPYSPINLSVEKANKGKLTLKWYQPESELKVDRYYVTAEKGSGGYFTNESKSTATSLVIDYIPGEVTTYYVKAKYANGESSENSESVIFDATPYSPINLSVENVNNGQLTLKWDQPETGLEVDRYYITIEAPGSYGYTNIASTSLLINYTPGVVTTYYVKAKYTNGEYSEDSESFMFDDTEVEADYTLYAPSNLSIENVNNGQLTLKWDQSETELEVDRYYIHQVPQVQSSDMSVFYATSSVVNYIPGVTYTFYVKAKYTNGEYSEDSEPFVFEG